MLLGAAGGWTDKRGSEHSVEVSFTRCVALLLYLSSPGNGLGASNPIPFSSTNSLCHPWQLLQSVTVTMLSPLSQKPSIAP